jgi:hypothetical protein
MNKENINTENQNNENAAQWEMTTPQQAESTASREIQGGYHARKEDEASVGFFIDNIERGDCSVRYTGDGINGKEEALLSEYLHVMDEGGFNKNEALTPVLHDYMDKLTHDLAYIDAGHAAMLDGSEDSRKYFRSLDMVIGYCDSDFATEEDKAAVSEFMNVLDSKGAALSIMLDRYQQLYGDKASPVPTYEAPTPTPTPEPTPPTPTPEESMPTPEPTPTPSFSLEDTPDDGKESRRALEQVEDSLDFLRRSERLSDDLLEDVKKTAANIDASFRNSFFKPEETRRIIDEFKKTLDEFMGSIRSLDHSNQDVVESLKAGAAYIDEDSARKATSESDRCQEKIDDARSKYNSRQEWLSQREDALRKMQQLQEDNLARLRTIRNY